LEKIRTLVTLAVDNESVWLICLREKFAMGFGDWPHKEEELKRLRSETRGQRKLIRKTTQTAKDLEQRLREEEDAKETLQMRLDGLSPMETKYRKALRLLGEYYCRIQALTRPRSQTIDRFEFTR
jgi:predicted RNase H-like nuclease (RuvC/YqgF family)